jgi:hypothetical protein
MGRMVGGFKGEVEEEEYEELRAQIEDVERDRGILYRHLSTELIRQTPTEVEDIDKELAKAGWLKEYHRGGAGWLDVTLEVVMGR